MKRLTLIPALLLFALPAAAQTCDATLWQHVYNPQRLVVNQACISVTGTIVDATHGKRRDGLRHEGDGDTHGWLKVDPEFADLLNAGNKSNEGGNLVFEAICQFRVTQKDAVAACKNFKSAVKIPPPGTRVRITGTYVQDQEHAKWMELHPVTSIEVLSPAPKLSHYVVCGNCIEAEFTPLGLLLYRAWITKIFLIGCHEETS